MEKQYIAPELTLAGDAAEVVLGGICGGNDYCGWDVDNNMEFQADGDVEAGR